MTNSLSVAAVLQNSRIPVCTHSAAHWNIVPEVMVLPLIADVKSSIRIAFMSVSDCVGCRRSICRCCQLVGQSTALINIRVQTCFPEGTQPKPCTIVTPMRLFDNFSM